MEQEMIYRVTEKWYIEMDKWGIQENADAPTYNNRHDGSGMDKPNDGSWMDKTMVHKRWTEGQRIVGQWDGEMGVMI